MKMPAVIIILKAVFCENCLRKNKLLLLGPGGEASSRWAILAILGKNSHFNAICMTFCTLLEQLENPKLQ